MQHGPAPSTVAMFAEYGGDTVLWNAESGEGWPAEALGLSSTLAGRLRAWSQSFNDNYRWDSGWASDEARSQFLAVGTELLALVRQEAGDRFAVTPRFLSTAR